ncbi:FMN-dependent alpha-hydroxy acid dehydrogenase [Caballeronia hypogeia]|uniref:FMN-dependent alpha-hydroxy acid dehydrogenase n=1 Tax=Caballeronia hypogeia TaxID=1777140 RepID=A0A158DPY6_9BURK|nr:alpha-hydroxy acid oxidase [Caballeronia hypogeia]SAK96672.1 FMN-dependent alpha-hydroxy acid dehydrogenase [Caballeronia hypogeia]
MRSIDDALSIADLRELARRSLPRFVFEFIDGGAEDEITLAANRSAFERVALVPRVLNDVSMPDLSTPLLGARSNAPLLIAPMGSCTLARPGADLMLAQAAAARGIPYVQSTMSTTALETIARHADGRRWFQLYTLKDRDFTRKLIDRVRGADFEALVVTVDLAVGGKRERDLRNGIAIPLKPRVSHVLDAMRHPGWALRYLRQGSPQFENVRDLDPGEGAGLTIAHKVGTMLDAAFSFDHLARLRDQWGGRIVVKGVQHPADAGRLARLGIDAIWVSNHGGRQLDGAQSSLESLDAVRRALGAEVELIIDSGVRRGVDILKAVALGARAAGVARPVLFGAAVAGAAGALRAIDILLDEAKRAMALCGTPNVDAIRAGDVIASSSHIAPKT